jgi:hypothetical protein
MAYKFEKVKSVEERLDNLEAIGVGNKLDVQQGHINALVGRAYNLEGRAAALEAADTGIKERLDTLEQSGGGSNIQLDPYLTETGKAADAGAVGAEIQEIYTNINDLDGRVGNLEQSGGGTGGGGANGGGSVELDTTLTKAGKAADAKAVGDALGIKKEVYIVANGVAYTLPLIAKLQHDIEVTVKLNFVSSRPSTVEPSAVVDGGTIYLYVVDSTGIVYVDIGEGIQSLGEAFLQSQEYDRGWTNDANAETETGVYCEYKLQKSGGVTIIKIPDFEGDNYQLPKEDFEKMRADFVNTVLVWGDIMPRVLYPARTQMSNDVFYYSSIAYISGVITVYTAWVNEGGGTGIPALAINSANLAKA